MAMYSDITFGHCPQLIPANKSALAFSQKKIPNLSAFLRNPRFPRLVSCLLESSELNPQTVDDYVIEEQKDKNKVDLCTVNYLINSCGLSEKEANSAAKKLTLRNGARADSVLALFRAQGFSDEQISKLVKKRPMVLASDPVRTLFPKLEFLKSIGFKNGAADLGELVTRQPTILLSNVENTLVPCYKILKEVLSSDELVYRVISRCSYILSGGLPRTVVPNMEVLREVGVPQSRINKMLLRRPWALLVAHDQFREAVIHVKELGFYPSLSSFVTAVCIFAIPKKKMVMDECYNTYMRLGWWSNEDILSAFKKYPFTMEFSEVKICTAVEYLINKIRWPIRDIETHLLRFNLKNWIIPRCSVVQFLHSKGLLERLPKLLTVLTVSQDRFLDRYVITYAVEAPEVLQFYEGKKNFLHE